MCSVPPHPNPDMDYFKRIGMEMESKGLRCRAESAAATALLPQPVYASLTQCSLPWPDD